MLDKATRTRLRILDAARQCFAESGFEATTIRDIAQRAGISLGLMYRYFPAKEHLALAVYDALAVALTEQASTLPAGTILERFRVLMHAKLDLLEPQRGALLALFVKALDPSARAGVLSTHTQTVRSRVSGLFAAVAAGATPPASDVARVGRMLYGLHLLFVMLWTQDTTPGRQATRRAVDLCCSLGGRLTPLLAMSGQAAGLAAELDGILAPLLRTAATEPPDARARLILDRLLAQRRSLTKAPPSPAAIALHEPMIRRALDTDAPLQLVLPAFPAKSPSAAKVLGTLPDMAESIALQRLQRLCDDLAEAHPPGVTLTLASDGHVFADVVGVEDEDVDAYGAALAKMARKLGCHSLRFLSLRDIYPDLSPDAARQELLTRYAEPAGVLQQRLRERPALRSLSNGIHRFLAEEHQLTHPDLSRSQVKKQTRTASLEVVRRSRAWGRLVQACFPDALRLSIHPQPDVSPKLGVHLIDTGDAWLTPWHGVAVLDGEHFRLMKRMDAEALGAVVVKVGRRPSHMEIPA